MIEILELKTAIPGIIFILLRILGNDAID